MAAAAAPARPMPVHLRRLARALAFIAVTVTLAKAAQYAAVDRLSSTIGFAAASFVGAAPVVAAAAVVRGMARQRRHARQDQTLK